MDRFGKRAGKQFTTIDRKSLEILQAYGWPGNVRELQNVIERAVLLSDGDVFCVDEAWLRQELPRRPKPKATLAGTLVSQEKEMIEAALAASQGRVSGLLRRRRQTRVCRLAPSNRKSSAWASTNTDSS